MKHCNVIKMLMSTLLVVLAFSQCAAIAPTSRKIHPPKSQQETGVSTKDDSPLVADLIETGKKLLGKPYRYRGGLPWAMDCSGFVSYVFSKYDISLPHSSAAQAAMVIPVKTPMPGDLLFFKGRNRGSNRVGHVALVIDVVDGDPIMMHSTNSRGIIIERLGGNQYFSSRFIKAGRVPELAKKIDDGTLMVPEPTLSPLPPKTDPKIKVSMPEIDMEVPTVQPNQWAN